MQEATLVQTLTLYSNILHLVLFCVVFCGILKYCPPWLQHIPLVVSWNNILVGTMKTNGFWKLIAHGSMSCVLFMEKKKLAVNKLLLFNVFAICFPAWGQRKQEENISKRAYSVCTLVVLRFLSYHLNRILTGIMSSLDHYIARTKKICYEKCNYMSLLNFGESQRSTG